MEQQELYTNLLFAAVLLFIIGISCIIFTFKKRDEIIAAAEKKSGDMIKGAKDQVSRAEERIARLSSTDKEIVERLKESRALIEGITDQANALAADIELITEEDLLSSQSYQEDRKAVKSELKKLACNAINGVTGANADVNIGKFVAVSAKADMAGALLLTTVEMLSAKTNANNGHQSLEKLFTSIIAAEALIRGIDSRAHINPKFSELLEKRLQIEINFKKAKQASREKQKEIREQEREERKARQEAERIQKEAEKEESIKQKAIEELEAKLAEENAADREAFEEQLAKLKLELAEAHDRFERAKSRAQETKQGHVYVVSNIGSFGKEVLKIGMTRRMDPMDRVKELGDASVPFSFDVHALIESDDAPNLENELHRIFDSKRVNKVNRRKEYFNVTIDQIEKELLSRNIDVIINKVASADEYYQSLKVLERSA